MAFARAGLSLASLVASLALVTACGDKEKGKAAIANLALANGTGLGLTDTNCFDLGGGYVPKECFTPTLLDLKILNVIISPDAAGALSGPAGLIWANPDCAVSTSQSTIDDKEYEYDSATGGDCTDDTVSKFFSLARPTAEVNAELNAKDYKILPGTYNYVQVTFCTGGPKSKNARFQTADMPAPYEVQSGVCGISSVKADPPIVVGEGGAVTVSLTYDLTNIIPGGHEQSDPASCYLNDDKTTVRCFGHPRDMKPGFVNR